MATRKREAGGAGDDAGASEPGTRLVSLRLPAEVLERADELAPRLEREDLTLRAWGRVSRGAVLRLAVVKGLEAIETALERKARRGGAGSGPTGGGAS